MGFAAMVTSSSGTRTGRSARARRRASRSMRRRSRTRSRRARPRTTWPPSASRKNDQTHVFYNGRDVHDRYHDRHGLGRGGAPYAIPAGVTLACRRDAERRLPGLLLERPHHPVRPRISPRPPRFRCGLLHRHCAFGQTVHGSAAVGSVSRADPPGSRRVREDQLREHLVRAGLQLQQSTPRAPGVTQARTTTTRSCTTTRTRSPRTGSRRSSVGRGRPGVGPAPDPEAQATSPLCSECTRRHHKALYHREVEPEETRPVWRRDRRGAHCVRARVRRAQRGRRTLAVVARTGYHRARRRGGEVQLFPDPGPHRGGGEGRP